MEFDSKTGKQLLSKVPEITLYFWIIKILCTTVGQITADYLNISLNFGLTITSIITGVLLVIASAGYFIHNTQQQEATINGFYWI